VRAAPEENDQQETHGASIYTLQLARMRKRRTGDDLLTQVWETPEDPGVLAIYADWLIEHGDTARGEYIQLSLLDAPSPAQERRREALRKQHRAAWLGPARPYVYTWEESANSPSFVAQVKCGVGKLAKGFDHIRALGPRLLVALNPVKTAADRALLGSLPLGRLYGLGLYETDLLWVSDRLILAIAPKLAGLRRLELFVAPEVFTLAGWRALLAIDTLDELAFASFDAPDHWLEALLDSALARRLRWVTLPRPVSPALRRRLRSAFAGANLTIR